MLDHQIENYTRQFLDQCHYVKIGQQILASHFVVTLDEAKESELIQKDNEGRISEIESWQLKSFRFGSLRHMTCPYHVFDYEIFKEQYDEVGAFVQEFVQIQMEQKYNLVR